MTSPTRRAPTGDQLCHPCSSTTLGRAEVRNRARSTAIGSHPVAAAAPFSPRLMATVAGPVADDRPRA
ncbi:MAG: hypothetical protein ACYCU7_15175 [Acidimicrobiales bacterium]